MTTKLSIAGLVVAAAASSAFAFGAAPVKAGCLSANVGTNCATFSQASPSNAIDGAYTDGVFSGNNTLSRIKFYHDGITTGLPITLTDIAYSFDGGSTWDTTNLSATSYVLQPSYTSDASALNLLTGDVTYTPTSNFQLRFTIPTNPALAPTLSDIYSYVRNTGTAGATPQTQTRIHQLIVPASTVATPGPLPLLGAGVAFTFSRTVRKRIRQAV
jgi:hypothetical protein